MFIGKPKPLRVRTAQNYLGVHSEHTAIVGDRMDTDIITGVQNGLETILVLTGVTRPEEVTRFPYVPTYIYPSVAEVRFEGDDPAD